MVGNEQAQNTVVSLVVYEFLHALNIIVMLNTQSLWNIYVLVS